MDGSRERRIYTSELKEVNTMMARHLPRAILYKLPPLLPLPAACYIDDITNTD